ncbi:NADH-quinone oxidoreductase subunit N [Candidatus Methylomirabilis sp.]|uniref:NADH-quinone oxidoreductase subunit N n=1 Tax=Candidatus Methylomirabilis sp. TaxID=2032687 RepID=UPI002A65C8E6|nr:NADH-quinone oxidoreductase subunit N [Candidatus Methylomirabilis sp.]
MADISTASPEVVLSLVAMVILMLDFIAPKGGRDWLGYLSILGVLVTFMTLIGQWGVTQPAFSGQYLSDPFAFFFKIVFLVSAALILLMSIGYLKSEGIEKGEFYGLILFATLGMMLMVSAVDLLILYIGLETMSISIYVLAGFLKREQRSSEAALKYLLMGGFSSAIMLYGIVMLYGLTGTIGLREIASTLSADAVSNPALILGMVMLVAGFGFKIAAVPFHMYLPDVYEGAPTPVVALLSAASEVAGLAILLRVFLVAIPGLQDRWTFLFYLLSLITMTVGNVVAVVQSNIKRMLAYSSIAHIGYLLIGLVAGRELGISATLLYTLIYALMTLGAFAMVILLCVGEVKGERIDDFTGLAQRSPMAAAAMLIFLLSLAGVPPTAGFVGKLYLFGAAIERGYVWLAVIAVMNSAISLFYYMKVVMAMYMRDLPPQGLTLSSSRPLRLALLVTLAGTIAIGIYPGPFLDLARASVAGLW